MIDTTTSEGFRAARERLELSLPRCARLLNVDERTLKRWEGGQRPPHPTAAAMLRGLLEGWRPRDWHMTGADLAAARAGLGLSQTALAELLDVEDATLAAWESDSAGPPPVVERAIIWLEDGWTPEPGPRDQ